MSRPKKSDSAGIALFFKRIIAVVVLAAFVLSISYTVKALNSTDTTKVLSLATPLLERLHINDSRLGNVAGAFVTRSKNVVSQSTQHTELSPTLAVNDQLFRIAFISDSHNDSENLKKALALVNTTNVTQVFFLGDYTDLGVIPDLQTAKAIMDAGNLPYESLPGDHDLWKSVGPQNFTEVFGKTYFTKTIQNYKFVGLDNSANYTTINDDIVTWFKNELTDADFVLLSQPLYHPSNNIVMGIVNGEQNQAVRFQALELLKMIRNSKVKAIIAGDQHLSSQNIDPEEPRLKHIVVGALTKERNLQTPRFATLTMYTDGSYKVEDVLIK